jgi:small subunit ribosomal protein S6
MPLYEHVFMARQDVSSQQVDALVEQFKGVIEQNGGSIAKVENWGVKPLAYRIKKNRKAHYALMNIDAPPAAVSEMERQMRINEDVLRYLTIRVDEHEDVPSVMLQKRDRDDRRRRDRDDFGGGREFGGGRDFGGRGDRGDRGDRRPRRDEDAGQETA